LIRYAVVLGLGYVLGAKAGRRRYEQIVGTYRGLTSSPTVKSLVQAGRRKVAERVSPDAQLVTLAEIDTSTSVVQPQRGGGRN
jgi:aspartate aminotransferase-like enzyme